MNQNTPTLAGKQQNSVSTKYSCIIQILNFPWPNRPSRILVLMNPVPSAYPLIDRIPGSDRVEQYYDWLLLHLWFIEDGLERIDWFSGH